MKKVTILSNDHNYTYKLRREIVEALIKNNYQVHLVLPYGPKVDYFIELCCSFSPIEFDKRGKNPFNDAKYLIELFKILRKEQPDCVISYTIKPNIYGGLICRYLKIPFIPNITGLGSAVENPGILQKVLFGLYKLAFKDVQTIFFQNKENRQYFIDRGIEVDKHKLLPGSGVNLEQFTPLKYPNGNTVEFVYISRIMKEKGIEQYLETAKYIREKYPNTRFHICGSIEEDYVEVINELDDKGVIIYHGVVDDVRKILEKVHCIIHPTYYPEGLSNVLLESSASARPIITTDRSGCREVVEVGKNGYLVEEKNVEDLLNKTEKFVLKSYVEKKEMGEFGRKKIENEFDRNIVVEKYLKEVAIS